MFFYLFFAPVLPQKETIIATRKHKVGIPLFNAGPHATQSFADRTPKQETIIATHAWHFHVVSCTAFVGTALALNGGMSTLYLRVAIIVSFHGCRFETKHCTCRPHVSVFGLRACASCLCCHWLLGSSVYVQVLVGVRWSLFWKCCRHPSTCL